MRIACLADGSAWALVQPEHLHHLQARHPVAVPLFFDQPAVPAIGHMQHRVRAQITDQVFTLHRPPARWRLTCMHRCWSATRAACPH